MPVYVFLACAIVAGGFQSGDLRVARDIEPRTERIVVAPAETLAVTIRGSGDPVLIVPGLLGSAFGFRHVIPELVADSLQSITIDPLGTGGSSRPRDADYSLESQASRVAAAADSLGLRGAFILTHSVGASIAYRLAIQRPDLVAGIVSINGGPAERAGTPGLRLALRFAPLARLFGGRDMLRGKVKSGLRDSSADDSWVTEEVVDQYAAPYQEDPGDALRTMREIASAEEPEALEPRLERITVPVLLLVGDGTETDVVDADEIATLVDRLPALHVDTVPDAGQYIQEERPDRVVAAIRELRAIVYAARWHHRLPS